MITETVARFIVTTEYSEIPQAAVSIAQRHILDCIGTTLAGSVEPEVGIVEEYLKELGGAPEATVIGRKLRTSAPQAALVNGVAAHVLDYDDVSWTWPGHPSVAVLPAVLALGEKYDVSGREALAAYILGIEVGAKLAPGMAGHYEMGWHATATIGTMAAAAAAARLLRLDVPKTQMALGMAASMASGLRQNFGTMTKSFHAGRAASNGVVAASLVGKGYTASANILEAPMGLPRLMGGERADIQRIGQNLGAPFDLVSPGLTLKPYPCCRFSHRCLDAILQLRKEHRIRASEVAQVTCRTSPVIPGFLPHSHPGTGLEAKFSMEYGVAVALLDGQAGLKQFTDERVNRPDVRELMGRVKYAHTDKTTKVSQAMAEPEEVVVELRDGRRYAQKVTLAKGEPENPMSDEEVTAKFHDCAGLVFTPERQAGILERLWHLESLERVSELTGVLKK